MRQYVIIGAGLAGHRAALELRSHDPDAQIDLVGDEDALPYDRPPLSKDLLLGKAEHSTLKDADRYGELGITFHRNIAARTIDTNRREVTLASGQTLAFDALLIATGSRVRPLPQAIAGGADITYLRTHADALALRAKLRPGAALVVIGGGFIGLEVAAVARALECSVTVVEAADRLVSRALPPEASAHLQRLHTHHGVRILTHTSVTAIRQDGAGQIVVTGAGEFPADLVVAGIGALPNAELAEAAGITVDDGIVVDGHCHTSHADIFAAGEVTAHPVAATGARRRLESWKVAQAQPAIAAAAMAGAPGEVYGELPWFWSDQFDCNLQMIGSPECAKEFRLRGASAGESWSLIGLDGGGRPVSGVAINAGRDISVLRRAMTRGTDLPEGFFTPGD